MSDYYGFTNEERVKGGRIQTWAYKVGHLVRPENCTACLAYGPTPGEIIAHLEDYTEPIAGAIFLCLRCHTMVHLRFENQTAWDRYRKAIREGYSWPLARSRWTVIADHVKEQQTLFPTRRPVNPERPSTILDEINDNMHHPGPREAWEEKMERIMNGERAYEIPSDQEKLF